MSVASASLKRTQAQLSPRKGNTAKKARVPTDSDSSSDDNSSEEPRKGAYLTLPPLISSYVPLRIQFCRFEGVWRQVRVLTNYTFANLHTHSIFLWMVWRSPAPGQGLGRRGDSGKYNAYHIKSKGRIGPFPDFLDPDNTHHLAEHYYFGRGDQFVIVEDDQSTIGQVWNRQLTHNACRGKCLDKEIAIEYEYDLGGAYCKVQDSYIVGGLQRKRPAEEEEDSDDEDELGGCIDEGRTLEDFT
ncbi:hypothetical protein EV359DRAFT_78075 [Lentinula novae-zelandiae]|nr:hypothetical protein EV359DRAFT_78075 [Lentinula novae-zelandiae]